MQISLCNFLYTFCCLLTVFLLLFVRSQTILVTDFYSKSYPSDSLSFGCQSKRRGAPTDAKVDASFFFHRLFPLLMKTKSTLFSGRVPRQSKGCQVRSWPAVGGFESTTLRLRRHDIDCLTTASFCVRIHQV